MGTYGFEAETTDMGGGGGWQRDSEVSGTEEDDDNVSGALAEMRVGMVSTR